MDEQLEQPQEGETSKKGKKKPPREVPPPGRLFNGKEELEIRRIVQETSAEVEKVTTWQERILMGCVFLIGAALGVVCDRAVVRAVRPRATSNVVVL